MWIYSTLLSVAVIQVLISGSQTMRQTTQVEDKCIDISSNCPFNTHLCNSSTFVQDRCQKTCNLCPTENPTTVTPTTTDPPTPTEPPTETTPVPECGGEYASSSGMIRHPSNGGTYKDNEECVWTITTGHHFNITFKSFDLEDDYDFLCISDGDAIDSLELGNFTGIRNPSPLVLTSGTAYLRFTSDFSNTRTGFILEWETEMITTTPTDTTPTEPTTIPTTTNSTDRQGCGGDFNSSNGTIQHPMSGDSYLNDENCVWTIINGKSFNITFVRFDIERNFDYLKISDGNSFDSDVLGEFTGLDLPNSVEVKSGAASIVFTSDHTVTKTGFVLEWQISETEHQTTEAPACTDISPNCALNKFQCDTNPYVQTRCQKTCNLCHG